MHSFRKKDLNSLAFDGLDVRNGAENRTPETLAAKRSLVKTIEDNFLRNRIDLLQFTEDHTSFALYRDGVHGRVLQDVG